MAKDLDGISKHTVRTLKGFVIILIGATAFCLLERLCEWLQLPEYITFTAHWISIALVALDAIVLVGNALFWAVKMVAVGYIRARKDIKNAANNDK